MCCHEKRKRVFGLVDIQLVKERGSGKPIGFLIARICTSIALNDDQKLN